MKKTKKIIALVLAAVMLVCTTVAATVAYLYSKTEVVENTFTVGDVKILLNEKDEDSDTRTDINYIYGGTDKRDTTNKYKVYPGMEYKKDPAVSVRTDSEKAYLRMIVTVSDIEALESAMPENIANDVFLLQSLVDWNTDWEYYGYSEKSVTVDNETVVQGVYEFRYKEIFDVTGKTGVAVTDDNDATNDEGTYYLMPALFTEINIPADLDNAHLAYFNNITIDVVAHAMQAEGFADAAAAWTAFEY